MRLTAAGGSPPNQGLVNGVLDRRTRDREAGSGRAFASSARLAVEHSWERHPRWIRSRIENPNFSISLEWSGADVSLANVLNPNR